MASRYTGVKIWLATASAGAVILGAAYFAAVPAASGQATADTQAQALSSSGSSLTPAQPRSAPVPRARKTRRS